MLAPSSPPDRPGVRSYIVGSLVLAVGVLGLVALNRSRPPPPRVASGERATPVRFLRAPSLPVVTQVSGHGYLRPGRTWEAVAQVEGRLIHRSPQLEAGAFLDRNHLLLEVDPTDYELAVRTARAEEASLAAQISQLDLEEQALGENLEIAREILSLAETELARLRQLVERSSATRTNRDREEQTVLGRRREVLSLQQALAQIPSRRAHLRAQTDANRSRRERALLDVERTRVLAPFSARVAESLVEVGQFVRSGQVMALLDGIERAEVTALVPRNRMRLLARSLGGDATARQMQETGEALSKMRVRIRLPLGESYVEWPARFLRIAEQVDPRTRMIGVVVEIPSPYGEVVPGQKPPLIKGMFVQAILESPPTAPQVLVPRSSLRGSQVAVIDAAGRLGFREVRVGVAHPRFVTLEAGLDPGSRVVLGGLLPAVEGMLLAPEEDQEALAALEAEAGGAL